MYTVSQYLYKAVFVETSWTPHAVYLCIKGIISAVLTKCSRNEGFIPVNKNLW